MASTPKHTTNLKSILGIAALSLIGAFGIFFANNTLKDDTEFRSSAWGANGAKYYVDKDNKGGKGCNDSWTGSLDQPFCTINKGLQTFQPGDNLFVRAGTYPSFTVTRSGSKDFYFNISAYENERPIIKGGEDAIKLDGVSYVRINGFEVTGATSPYWGGAIRVTHKNGVLPTYNIIENNYVHDNLSSNISGILIENGSYNEVIGNTVENNYLNGIYIVAHPTISKSGISNNKVVGNRVTGHLKGAGNSDGIKIEGGGAKHNLIQDNTVYGNGDDGIDTWNSSENQIIGNVSYDHIGPGDGNGFKLGGYTNKDGVISFGGNNVIKNNTAYGNKYNGFDSNGSGANFYEGNNSYKNGFASTSRNAWGIQDSYRENGDTRPSTIINNNAWGNKTANYAKGQYTATFSGNTEQERYYSPSTNSPAPTPTPTLVPTPSSTTTPSPITTSPASNDQTLPVVSITNPIEGSTISRGSKIQLSAKATDNLGVAHVTFQVNGSTICTQSSTPYDCTWKVPNARNRTYSITAIAKDTSGNVSSTAVSILAK